MTKRNMGALMLVVVAIAVGAYFFIPTLATAPTNSNDSGNALQKIDLIRLTTPASGSTVSSPLVLSGTARGTWYFEASFPYRLLNDKDVVLAQGPVKATGDWMTEDFVPFTTTITFPAQKKGSHGTLILAKDNPSGMPEKDDQLVVPIVF